MRRHLVVVQSVGEQSVDGIPLGNGERGNLLMFLYFRVELFAGDYQPRRNESEASTSAAKRNGCRQANHRQSGAKTCAGKRCRENAGVGGAPKYWSAEMKEALGLGDSGGFPYQLSPLGSKVSLPIPAVPFDGKAPSLKKIFDDAIQIYVTPDQYFKHTSGTESKHWLGGPDMKYWPQQLNFAVFCATQGCGVSREIFDSGMDLPPQIRAFYKFHVYFTVRRRRYSERERFARRPAFQSIQ